MPSGSVRARRHTQALGQDASDVVGHGRSVWVGVATAGTLPKLFHPRPMTRSTVSPARLSLSSTACGTCALTRLADAAPSGPKRICAACLTTADFGSLPTALTLKPRVVAVL